MANAKEKKADDVIVRPKKRLTDLYVVGDYVEFPTGDDDEPLKVWLQKLTPAEVQMAADEAKPLKSVITSVKRLPVDDPAKAMYLDELDRPDLLTKMDRIKYLISPKMEEVRISLEFKIGDEEEWSKDDYLIGLQNAWADGLRDKWVEDQEDPEASRVYKELKRFTDLVSAEAEAEEKELIYEIQDLSEEEVDRRVINRFIEEHANRALIEEFRIQQVFFATRDPDNHKERYFSSREELDLLHANVINTLLVRYSALSVETMEGKD